MQEEVEQRVVTLVVNCSKLTEQELKKALSKLLAQMKAHHQAKQPHGKMTVKQLAAQNRGMQSVEVTDQNIGSFTRIARKYGIDFAPFKAKDQDRYLIFFKSQDADAMTAAFKEYTAQTVHKHFLENREYTGCLVNFKTEKVSYKVKQSKENPEEKQVIFENHHEPIIDRDTWERVQELRKQRKRPNRYDEVGLFSGILFCADCGSVMYQQRYQTDKRRQDCYICGSYKKRTRDCTAHFIRTDLLTEGVTENLRKVTSYAAKHEARFMKLLTEQTEDGSKRRNAAKKKELEAAEKRIAELSAIFKRLYEDSVTGRISDERFMELSADYEAEQKELKERAAVLQGELSRTLEATANAEKFMKVVRKYTSFEELTPTLLREFVEKIVIHESEALDGKRRGKLRRQEIEIYYSFVGKVELPD